MTARKAAAERFADTLSQLQGSRGVARRLLTLTSNPDFDLNQVVACLEADPALTAKTLRVVNSSRYGLRQKVGGVRQAAALLGQKSLRLFAVSFSVMDGLSKGPAAPLLAGYARRAVLMASTAARLAKREPRAAAPDEAYTGGLLADVGVLILAQYQPKIYLPAYESCLHGPELVAAERDLFDLAHPELGARFLSRWGLPPAVVAAVAGHHADPAWALAEQVADEAAAGPTDEDSGPGPRLAEAGRVGEMLRAADLFAAALADPSPIRTRAAADMLRTSFGVTDVAQLAAEVAGDVADAAEIFGVSAGPVDASSFSRPVAASA